MGRVILSGGNIIMNKPLSGISASDLAVGSSVYLKVNGVSTKFIVVNQGVPSNSSLYDSACDGTWLLAKDIYTEILWSSSDNDYAHSDAHTYLNSTFLELLDDNTKKAIKTVKIPHVLKRDPITGSIVSGPVVSGSEGLSSKVFLLSPYEVNLAGDYVDGAALSYFSGTGKTNANRTAIYPSFSKTQNYYWATRSPNDSGNVDVLMVYTDGQLKEFQYNVYKVGIRPALVLQSDAKFDRDTLVLKGVI